MDLAFPGSPAGLETNKKLPYGPYRGLMASLRAMLPIGMAKKTLHASRGACGDHKASTIKVTKGL